MDKKDTTKQTEGITNNRIIKYSKQQFLLSKKYVDIRDVIEVVLINDHSYTISEVDELINKFMKGKVI